MKENWDYVSFANYEADTRELTTRAAVAIDIIKSERDEAFRMLWAIVKASGGLVKVPESFVQQDIEGEIEYSEYDMAGLLRVPRTVTAREEGESG